MLRRLTILTLFVLAPLVLAADGANYTAKTAMVAVPTELKAPFRELLSEQAYQVSDGKETICTLWLRKEVPVKATADQVKNGLTYREVPITTFIGAIKFDKPWNDFRNQEIGAGVYTLRIALQPQDGDHMGTAPHPDFCLLVPAAKDEKPETMPIKSLHEMSGDATGGTHPGVVLLFPNNKPEDAAKVVSKGNGIWVLNFKQAIKAGDVSTSLGFSITIAGHAAE